MPNLFRNYDVKCYCALGIGFFPDQSLMTEIIIFSKKMFRVMWPSGSYWAIFKNYFQNCLIKVFSYFIQQGKYLIVASNVSTISMSLEKSREIIPNIIWKWDQGNSSERQVIVCPDVLPELQHILPI